VCTNADGPCDATSHPFDHMTMHTMTELNVESLKCIHEATASVYTDSTLLHRPTTAGF